MYIENPQSRQPSSSAAALCAKALAEAVTDNNRVAALLLTSRQLDSFSSTEARSVFAQIDAKFLLRLLLIDNVQNDGDIDADSLAHASVAASILGRLAEQDLSGLVGRSDFPDLLAGLCRCLARWQPLNAVASADEVRQLISQLHRTLYHIISGLETDRCKILLPNSPIIDTLVRAVILRQSDWESSLRLVLVALDRYAFAGVLNCVAASLDELLNNLTTSLIKEYSKISNAVPCGKSQTGESLGKSQTGESQGKSLSGESQGTSPSGETQGKSPSGESQGKSQTGESQGKSQAEQLQSDEPNVVEILQFLSQLLSYATPNCAVISSGRLAAQLRPLMPGFLGNRNLRGVSLSLLANIASASPRGLADVLDNKTKSAASSSIAESDLLHLVGSLSALEIDVRLNLADESDRAFELVAASSQHRETLGACFVLLEETIRRLLQQQQKQQLEAFKDQRPDLLERLLTQLSGAFDILLDRLVNGALKSMKHAAASDADDQRPRRLFLAACSRCLCLWLSEGGELAEQCGVHRSQRGASVGIDDDSKRSRAISGFVQLLSWLMGAEETSGCVDNEDVDDVARAALPYLCSLTSSDDGVELLRNSNCALVRYLMSNYLARQLTTSSAKTELLSPLINLLLNLTLGQMHSAQEDQPNLCFTGQQLANMITCLTDHMSALIDVKHNHRLSANDALSVLVLSLASLRLALLLSLSPLPSSTTCHRLIVTSLRHIDSCSPNDFNADESNEELDEDGIGDLQLLILRLTGELLTEHGDAVQVSVAPVPDLLRHIVRVGTSAKSVSEEFDDFVKLVVEFASA